MAEEKTYFDLLEGEISSIIDLIGKNFNEGIDKLDELNSKYSELKKIAGNDKNLILRVNVLDNILKSNLERELSIRLSNISDSSIKKNLVSKILEKISNFNGTIKSIEFLSENVSADHSKNVKSAAINKVQNQLLMKANSELENVKMQNESSRAELDKVKEAEAKQKKELENMKKTQAGQAILGLKPISFKAAIFYLVLFVPVIVFSVAGLFGEWVFSNFNTVQLIIILVLAALGAGSVVVFLMSGMSNIVTIIVPPFIPGLLMAYIKGRIATNPKFIKTYESLKKFVPLILLIVTLLLVVWNYFVSNPELTGGFESLSSNFQVLVNSILNGDMSGAMLALNEMFGSFEGVNFISIFNPITEMFGFNISDLTGYVDEGSGVLNDLQGNLETFEDLTS